MGMLKTIGLAVFGASLAAATWAQVPESRFVLSRDVDFYGADLDPLFDTTLNACMAQCAADQACAAFTFNARANACFPKRTMSDRTAYDGAISGAKVATDPSVLLAAPARAQDLVFLGDQTLDDAQDMARDLGLRHAAGSASLDQLVQAARAAQDPLGLIGAAVSVSDRADLWSEYARLLLERQGSSSDRRRNAQQALLAAANGYLRAESAGLRVGALIQLARASEAVGRGRDMIPALRLAQTIQARPDSEQMLDNAIRTYGFRVVDTRVDSDAAAPRICAEFSEDLVRAGQDYAPFVGLEDDRLAVTVEGRSLCVDGVTHGERYRLVLRQGLPAASGEVLWKDVEITQYVRDRAPSVRFPGRGYVLPKVAGAHLPIETVNIDRIDLELSRVSDRNLTRAIQEDIFARPLSYWQQEEFSTEFAEQIWVGTAEVDTVLNRDMMTRLPLAKAIMGQPAGIYTLTARIPGADLYDQPAANQWFVLTDLGLASAMGTDGLQVSVRGLADAQARPDVTIELISRGNAVLGQVETDADGIARFQAGLTRGTQAAAPAMIVARTADDMAFLSLTDPAFDLSDRGVAGRLTAGPVDVFLTTDRGAYRAGETIHATALARDAQIAAVEGLPITAILRRPDGVEHGRQVSANGLAGGHVFALPLGETVPRGTWTLDVHVDPKGAALASTKVLVEDFLPERIDFDMSLSAADLRAGEAPPLDLQARYLFGAPGADLAIDGSVMLTQATDIKGWNGYHFGRHDDTFSPMRSFFGGTRTGADGAATLVVEIPQSGVSDRPLQAIVTARVSDGAARPVERQITAPVLPDGPVIGIKPLFDGVVAQGTDAAFDLALLSPDLTPTNGSVEWTLNRVERRYQWYQLYGNWSWEPVERRTRIASGSATVTDGPVQISTPVDWGQYELIVERTDGAYVASSLSFDAGWYAADTGSDTPDRLDMSLDQDSYRPGDTARLRVMSRHAGTALISVMTDQVIDRLVVDIPQGASDVPLAVTQAWGTGAYVTASVIRPMDVEQALGPARALGVAYARIMPGDKALTVTLDVPDAQPRSTVSVGVQVDGIAAGDTAYVTLAAVDLGILNLTGFDAPDPQGFYFGQRRLGVELRDVYGRLIDGMTGALGQVRSGGDATAGLRRQSPPPTQDLMAVFSGPVTVDAQGLAQIDVPLPAFNGTVRLMAVAWSDTGVGQAQADMLVRDPIVATLNTPRFLAPGDHSRLWLELTHADGPTGQVGLALSAPGLTLTGLPETLDLEQGETHRLALDITAPGVGDYPITLTITAPDGRQRSQTVTLPVRAHDPVIAQTRRFRLGAGESFTFDANVFANMRPGTGRALMSAGPLARFDVPGLISRLEQYPYGCTEQVTSRALPLLYLSSMLQSLGQTGPGIDGRISDAIARILTRQAPNGGFGLWRPESGEGWLDAYVTDFLSRARAQGHDVSDRAFDLALDNLRNQVNYAPDFQDGGTDIAYALLVLAREGRASMADLRYFADVKADAFSTPLSVAQLGAALALYGDQLRADALFAQAGQMLNTPAAPGDLWRSDFGTALRDTAGVLRLALDAGSEAIALDPLVQYVSVPNDNPSPQEAAWTLMAAQALVDRPEATGLLIDGVPAQGPFIQKHQSDSPVASVITAASGRDIDITLTTMGVPIIAPEAGGSGYVITREYYGMDGTALTPGHWALGDRFVTVLRVVSAEKIGARIMVDDPLPAGVEIDNPSLLRSGDVAALGWLDPTETTHAEFRSDRFLAAVNVQGGQPVTLAYVARAVTPGTYHQPAASVEDMYRRDRRARTATNVVTISE